MTLQRVLHIIPNFGLGGAERMAVNLMRGLALRGFDVGAVSLFDRMGTDLEATLDESGIPVWYLGKRTGLDVRMFLRLDRVLRSFRPDVIHTHLSVLRYLLPLGSFARAEARIHTVHNIAERETDRVGGWIHRYAFSHGVVAVSIAEAVSRSLENMYGLKATPLIPNGIPVARYATPTKKASEWRRAEGIDEGAVVFVAVGRLSEQKNHALLIQAFAEGPASDPRARLVLVGDGPLRPRLGEQVRHLQLDGKVHFLGPREDVPEVLAGSDIFVLSSSWEGNPLAVMEAMAAGKPCVVTRVGGVAELVIDNETGIVTPPGDVAGLAASMNRLLRDSVLRAAMGGAAAARARDHFDIKVMVEAYEDLYRSLQSAPA